MNALILLVVMFALMWLLLIRPQRRRQQQQREMLSDLKPGDEIVTAGGVYGTIASVADDELMLEIAPGTTVRLARRAVAGVFPHEDEELEAGDDEPAADDEADAPQALENETDAASESADVPRR